MLYVFKMLLSRCSQSTLILIGIPIHIINMKIFFLSIFDPWNEREFKQVEIGFKSSSKSDRIIFLLKVTDYIHF